MNTKEKRKLKIMFEQSDKVLQMQAARSFKCSQQYICKTLKKYTSIRKRQKIIIPMRSEEQKAEARKRCGRLKFQKLKLMNDESIFTLSNSSSNGNSKFYTSNIRLAPKDVKYKKKEEV